MGEEVAMSPSFHHPRAPNNSPEVSMIEPRQPTQSNLADDSATVRSTLHNVPMIEPQQSTQKKPADMAETDTYLDGAGWSRVNWKAVIGRNTLSPSEQAKSILIDDADYQTQRLRMDAAVVESTKSHEYADQISITYETMNTPVPGLQKTHHSPVEPFGEDEIMDIENVRSPKRTGKSMRRQNVMLESMKYGEVKSGAAVQLPVLDEYVVEPSRKEQNTVDTSSEYQLMSRKRAPSSELRQLSISSQNQVELSRSQPLKSYANGTFSKRPRLENHEQSIVQPSGQQPSILCPNDTFTTAQQPSIYSQSEPSLTMLYPSASGKNTALSKRVDPKNYSSKVVGLHYDPTGPATLRAREVSIQQSAKHYENRPLTTKQQPNSTPLQGHMSSNSEFQAVFIPGPAAGYNCTSGFDFFPHQNLGPTPSVNAGPRIMLDYEAINSSGIMCSQNQIPNRNIDASTKGTVATSEVIGDSTLPSLATTSYDYIVSNQNEKLHEVRQTTGSQVSTQDLRPVPTFNQITAPLDGTRWETYKSQPPHTVHQHHQEHKTSVANTSPRCNEPKVVRRRGNREERTIAKKAARLAKRNAKKVAAPNSNTVKTILQNSIQQWQAGLLSEKTDITSTDIALQAPSDIPKLAPLTTFAAMGKPKATLSLNAARGVKRTTHLAGHSSQRTSSVVNHVAPVATSALSGTFTESLPPAYLRYSVKDGISMVTCPPPKDINILSSRPQLPEEPAVSGATMNNTEPIAAPSAPTPTHSNCHPHHPPGETQITPTQLEICNEPEGSIMNGVTKFSQVPNMLSTDIRVPAFEDVATEGFLGPAFKIGYSTFASNTYDLNEGKVTPTQLEDAWEAAIWFEFQKWYKAGTDSEEKMTQYYKALHQIYDRSTEPLGGLAEMEGLFPPIKDDEKCVEARKEQTVEIKIPLFKKIVKKGFVEMLAGLPFQSFAQAITEYNEGPVTLKQIEDAWEKFLWLTFQKWNTGMEFSEIKVACYSTALNQIHTRHRSKLFKELAKREGRTLEEKEVGEAAEKKEVNVKVKVPALQEIINKGFLNLVIEFGYQRFSQSMYDCNEGKVTLKLLEKAWEALIWLEFQKWEDNSISPQTKKYWYNDAINQIHHRNTPLLKNLSKKAGRPFIAEDRGNGVDTEDVFQSLPPEEDSERIAASPTSKVIRQDRAEYSNCMQTVLFLPGYFDVQARGGGLPFMATGARMQYATDYYWDADGKPLADPEIAGTIDGELEQKRAELKIEVEEGRTIVGGEDLYDDSGDEGVKARKATHGKKSGVIDLSGDDVDIEVAGDLAK